MILYGSNSKQHSVYNTYLYLFLPLCLIAQVYICLGICSYVETVLPFATFEIAIDLCICFHFFLHHHFSSKSLRFGITSFFSYFFNFIFLLNFLIQCNIIMFFHFPNFSHILPTFLPTQIYILSSKQQQTNKKEPWNKIKNKQTIKKIKANRKGPVRQDEMSKQSKMK